MDISHLSTFSFSTTFLCLGVIVGLLGLIALSTPLSIGVEAAGRNPRSRRINFSLMAGAIACGIASGVILYVQGNTFVNEARNVMQSEAGITVDDETMRDIVGLDKGESVTFSGSQDGHQEEFVAIAGEENSDIYALYTSDAEGNLLLMESRSK